ncbi:MAG: hypothetical protein HQK52_23445 [Oligoflexia bacterium]|nr:hypothetical protein [Oligoflexia bacterium]
MFTCFINIFLFFSMLILTITTVQAQLDETKIKYVESIISSHLDKVRMLSNEVALLQKFNATAAELVPYQNEYWKYNGEINTLYSQLSMYKNNPAIDHGLQAKLLKALDNIDDKYKTPFNRISKSDCEETSYDNQALMGPDTPQGAGKLCWAYATAALLEEQLCLSNPKYCGQLVSRSEIAAKTYLSAGGYNLARNVGGKEVDVLSFYTDANGGNMRICLEKYGHDLYSSSDGAGKLRIAILGATYQLYQQEKRQMSCPSVSGNSNQLDSIISNVIGIVGLLEVSKDKWSKKMKNSSSQLDINEIKKLMDINSDPNAFVQDFLLYYCKDSNLKSFARNGVNLHAKQQILMDAAYDPLYDKGDYKIVNVGPHMTAFKEAKAHGHSVALGICQYPLERNLGVKANAPSGNDLCGSHAVVINGMRWNDQSKQCEVHLKNSRNVNDPLASNWYPAEIIFAHSNSMSYLTASP